MPEAGALPTARDEAWRYADIDALERIGADPRDALDTWEEVALSTGETRRHCMVVGGDTPELHRIRLTLAVQARAELFVTVAGNAPCRIEIEVALDQGAHYEFGGVTIGGGDAVREIVSNVIHAQPHATSNQVIRSVHWGQAAGNFLGAVDVARNAQKTDATQDFKGLLLEKGARVNAVPQLEIFADDVKCAHGASIGQLDEMAGYYMASRGIAPEHSRRLLVCAFLGDAFVAVADSAEQGRLLDAALNALGDVVGDTV